jgi:peptidoglycan/LPS O-acetylase OafA/YrhL
MAEQERPAFTYIPGIDGIRGIWVVIGPLLYHAAADTVSGGILGIDLFFTLSSFLIISIALNEFEKTGRIDLKAYAGRRARRLLPALFLALGGLTLY